MYVYMLAIVNSVVLHVLSLLSDLESSSESEPDEDIAKNDFVAVQDNPGLYYKVRRFT